MKQWKLTVFAALLSVLFGFDEALAQTKTSQTGEDWGAYPSDYKEIAQAWIDANVYEPDSVRDLQVCTPGKWWQRQSLIKGGKTSYGYRVMVMFTPKKRKGGYDKRQIHNLHIRNGEIIGEWKDKDEVVVRGETPEIQVHDLGLTASQDLNSPEEMPFSWVLIAQLTEEGHFLVTVTTPLDPTISATFECNGPGKLWQPFFARKDYPSLWITKKESGSRWFPFHFTFADTASNKRFELDQWANMDFRDIDKLTVALKKEKKKSTSASKSIERVSFDFDEREWQVGYSHNQPGQEIVEYVLPGETVDNWTELVTVQSLLGAQSSMTPEQTMLGAKEITMQQCPTAMWDVVRQDKNEVLYEWQTTDCPGTDNEYEIAKLLKGKSAIYRIAYACKKLPVSDSQRMLWMQLIGKAKLAPSDGFSEAKL